ncbi:MAG: acyl-CoA dehydrogenase family protein [Actinobacteria bacterium]|nr:acyl-CoA dehydrogenase family protein [Actinomycetota bacterium]
MSDADYASRCASWQRSLWDAGWAGIAWPKVFGGRGGRPMEASIFAQEQGRFGVSTGIFAVSHGMVGPTLMRHGTPEQQQRYLPAMLRGDDIWCQLFSEPEAGSDLAGLRTRAVHDTATDEWVVTGQKVWTSQAGESSMGILLARTDPNVPKHQGITYFLLDMSTPGIEIRPLRQMTGHSHFSEVFFDEVRVPAAQIVGGVGNGWKVAVTTLSNERAAISGSERGKELGLVLDLVRSTGSVDDPVVRQRVADCHTRHMILTFLSYRMQTALSQGKPLGAEASVMKLFYAEHLKRLADLAVAVEGPAGMLVGDDAPSQGLWQNRMLAALSIKIAGGSNEIQHNVIAERVLGLPRETQVDRDVPFRELLTRTSWGASA